MYWISRVDKDRQCADESADSNFPKAGVMSKADFSTFPFLPGVLCLLEHDEEYVFTLPCAYARSILTVPWVELGGKVSISCAKSGYSATVTFHTKPFYGGKVHR